MKPTPESELPSSHIVLEYSYFEKLRKFGRLFPRRGFLPYVIRAINELTL
jgi:hypothetical protein